MHNKEAKRRKRSWYWPWMSPQIFSGAWMAHGTWHQMQCCSAVLPPLPKEAKSKKNQRCLQLQQRILIQKNSSNLKRRTEGLNFDEFWEQNAPSHMSSNHNLEGLTCHTQTQRIQSWEPIRQCKGFCADPQGFPPIFLAFLQIMGYYPWQYRWNFRVGGFNSTSWGHSWKFGAFCIPMLPIPSQHCPPMISNDFAMTSSVSKSSSDGDSPWSFLKSKVHWGCLWDSNTYYHIYNSIWSANVTFIHHRACTCFCASKHPNQLCKRNIGSLSLPLWSSLSRRRFSSLHRWDDGDEGLPKHSHDVSAAEQASLVPVGGQSPESDSHVSVAWASVWGK